MDKYQINIDKNNERLLSDTYQIPNIFSGVSPLWPGDFEGRSLLAYCSLYVATKTKNPSMDLLINSLDKVTNRLGYFGEINAPNTFNEQQLSGNSWFLRGLVEYYKLFNSKIALTYASKVVNNLFVSYLNSIDNYPIERSIDKTGKVDGHIISNLNGWKLSSDVICAFMPLDGLGHYYQINPSSELLALIDKAVEKFMSIDKVKIKAQTHATLSAARGILRLYQTTNNPKYFNYCVETFNTYLKYGMTKNYENYNWFDRLDRDIWTEPCCVTDSLILAIELYNITKDEKYKTLAQRIWFNGMQFCLRITGGCGTNNCVDDNQPYLANHGLEAFKCCSMRYSEGLKYYYLNKNLFIEEDTSIYVEDKRIFKGNHILCEDVNNAFKHKPHYQYKDLSLIEIPTLVDIPFIKLPKVKLKVIFDV